MKNLFKAIFIFLTFIICFDKGFVFIEIEVKLPAVRKNLLEQINFQGHCIFFLNYLLLTYFNGK